MTDSLVSIDYALAMADGVGPRGGLTGDELDGEAKPFAAAVRNVREKVRRDELGFWTLPEDRGVLDALQRVRDSLDDGIRDVLVLGIGGSSLGGRALYQALAGPNEAPDTQERRHPRLHFPDNSDPWLLAALLDRLQPRHTAALVISKSGGTVETAAQYLVVRRWLRNAIDDASLGKHLVIITDPDKGPLRELARERKLPSLEVPPSVGGRFSALTPVGLLPAFLCGIDVGGLLEGAAHMSRRCDGETLRQNPAGIIAAIHVLQHRLRQRPIHVMMPYADSLRPFANWYVQLWAESLGKRVNRSGQVVESGPTPLPAVGATDQHAQVQLFKEGPRDKLVTFIHVERPSHDLEIPNASGAFSYLSGKSLAQLLDAERIGTTQALANDGRPSLTLQIQRVDAHSLGALMFLYEAATAFAGELYDIDAFNQPGVEEGKKLAFGLLGRHGFEREGEQIHAAQKKQTKDYRV